MTTTTQAPKSRSEFIRSLPADMPVGEIVKRAAAANLKVSQGLVYQVRAVQKKQKGRPPAAARGKTAARRGRPPRSADAASGDGPFRQAALDLGIARSRQILEELESRLRAIIEAG